MVAAIDSESIVERRGSSTLPISTNLCLVSVRTIWIPMNLERVLTISVVRRDACTKAISGYPLLSDLTYRAPIYVLLAIQQNYSLWKMVCSILLLVVATRDKVSEYNQTSQKKKLQPSMDLCKISCAWQCYCGGKADALGLELSGLFRGGSNPSSSTNL